MDTNIVQLFEALLNEATALEIYQQTQKDKMAPEVFAAILAMDPTSIMGEGTDATQILGTTKKGAYSDWLLRQYKNAGGVAAQQRMITEDAQQIKKYLEIYKAVTTNKEGLAKLQQAITAAQLQIANIKDLNQFKSIAILAQALTPFMKTSTEALSTKAENDIIVVYNDDTWQVVVPKTHAAARKYGTGTNWCTATSTSMHFKAYTKQGPLFIIRAKQLKVANCKWQYHKQSKQFMDFRDNALSVRRFLNTYLPMWPEKTKNMATAIAKSAKSAAWDFVTSEKDFTKELAEFTKAITDAENNVDEATIGKSPVVVAAVRRNDTDILDILLNQYKADPVIYDVKGISAISLAIQLNNIDAVKLLLQSGSPELMLSQRGPGGNTPIHRVAQVRNVIMLQAILEKLSSPAIRLSYLHIRNNNRNTPLMEAIMAGGVDNVEPTVLSIVELMVEASNPETSPPAQLEEAVRKIFEEEDSNNITPVSHILDLRNLDGHTAASLALSYGYLKVYNYLIQHGASLLAARKSALSASYFKNPEHFRNANIDMSPILANIILTPGTIEATINNEKLSNKEIADLVIPSIMKASRKQLGEYYSEAFQCANDVLVKFMHITFALPLFPSLYGYTELDPFSGIFAFDVSAEKIIALFEYLISQGWSLDKAYLESVKEGDAADLHSVFPEAVVSWISQRVSPKAKKLIAANTSVDTIIVNWYNSIYTLGIRSKADNDINDLTDIAINISDPQDLFDAEHVAIPATDRNQKDKDLLISLSSQEKYKLSAAALEICECLPPSVLYSLYQLVIPKYRELLPKNFYSSYMRNLDRFFDNLYEEVPDDIIRRYRQAFIDISKLIKPDVAQLNVGRMTILSQLFSIISRGLSNEVFLEVSPEFRGWLQDIRNMGGKLTKEMRSKKKPVTKKKQGTTKKKATKPTTPPKNIDVFALALLDLEKIGQEDEEE